jgi:CHAD domain-containing protein
LRDELRWLGGELGAVRDKDVLVGLLREAAGEFLESERRAAERVVAGLETEEEAVRERLLASMRSDRYVALLDRLVEACNAPSFVPGAQETNRATLGELGAGPWKKLRTEVKDLQGEPDDEALHRVRILTKRARYAAEALAPILGKPARTFAKAAASLQDVLGRNQDAFVAREWLRSASARTSSAQAFAAGMLVAVADGWSREARAAWPAAWSRLKKKRVPSWS